MRRGLALMLVCHVVVGSGPARAATPAAAESPRALHDRGTEQFKTHQYLEAAHSWLQALGMVSPTPATVPEVKSHFCHAMESLTEAQTKQDQAAEVRQAIDTRRRQLTEAAELLRQNPIPDIETCLERWQTLSQPPPATTAPPLPTDDDDPKPPPPPRTDKPPIGRWAGLGVSLAGVGAGAVMLGVGAVKFNRAYDSAYAKWDASATTAPIRVCGENDDPTPAGVSGDCDTYHSQRIVAAVGAGVLAASLVSTVVFAGLLGKHRAQRLSVSGARLRGGALLQATWRF